MNNMSKIELELMSVNMAFLKRNIKTLNDIVAHRSFFKYRTVSKKCYLYLLAMLNGSIAKILVKTDGVILKLFRQIIRANSHLIFDSGIMALSFGIFQKYYQHKNEEIQSCVNVMLKGAELSDEQLHWLINRYTESKHILNRILGYPTYSPILSIWASEMLREKLYNERLAELIGLTINNEIPNYIIEAFDVNEVMWGIYKSKSSDKSKQEMLLAIYNSTCADDLIQICNKLQYKNVLKRVWQIEKKGDSTP